MQSVTRWISFIIVFLAFSALGQEKDKINDPASDESGVYLFQTGDPVPEPVICFNQEASVVLAGDLKAGVECKKLLASQTPVPPTITNQLWFKIAISVISLGAGALVGMQM